MPIAYICDGGCGKSGVKPDFFEFGYAKKKIYCEGCAEDVRKHLSNLNDAHTEAAKLFEEKKSSSRQDWIVKHTNGTLPDE